MEKFKRLLPTILMIVFEIAIGIMLLIDGERLTYLIFIIFGSVMLVAGIISLISALIRGRKEGIQPLALAVSVIMIAVGGFFAAASGSVMQVVSTVTFIYGIILIISGVFKFADFMAFRSMTDSLSGIVLVSAILSVIFGFVIAFNPFGAAIVIWTLMGIGLLVSAFLDIITLVIYGKVVRQLEQLQ